MGTSVDKQASYTSHWDDWKNQTDYQETHYQLERKRRLKGALKNTLKLLALVTAYNIIRDVPDITLSREAGLHSLLQHKRHKKGYLLTGKVDSQDIERLRNILGDLPQGIVKGSGDFVNIIDTCLLYTSPSPRD